MWVCEYVRVRVSFTHPLTNSHTHTPRQRGRLMPTFTQRLTARLFGQEISRRTQMAIAALDDARDAVITGQRARERDRFTFDREDVLRDALEAWRTNPLARRIVSLTTQYVIGEGVRIESKHPATGRFLAEWWAHRLNHM